MDSDETQKALKILCDARKSKGDLLNPDDLILEMPLARGKKFGCDAEAVQREDSESCGAVDSMHPTSLHDIKGITQRQRTACTVRYVTNPDDTSLDFVAGVGITAYEYHRHGAVADTKLKRVELHPGENPCSRQPLVHLWCLWPPRA
jgi:hypothetical protein